MRSGILVARRIPPTLSHTPRRWFARPCVPTALVSTHRRLLHAGSSAEEAPKKEPQNAQTVPAAERDTNEKDQPAKVDSEDPSTNKPEKDLTWVFDHAGDKIDVLTGGVGTEGAEDWINHEGGAKLISSWSVAPGDEPVMWVPGKPFLSNLATQEKPSLVTSTSNVCNDSKATCHD